MARAQGRVRGAGAHLRASPAASSNRRGPRGRRCRRAKKYGRRLKPAPGLFAAPSLAVELSTRPHLSSYLEREKKGRPALFGAGAKRGENEAALANF